MRNRLFVFVWFFGLMACQSSTDADHHAQPVRKKPVISEDGTTILLPETNTIFKPFVVQKDALQGAYTAPATVIASILKPSRPEANVIILFDNPDLNNLYAHYLQSIAHYKRDTEFLERIKDMYANKAATGRELREAETGVADAATQLAEAEAHFRMLGFDPLHLNAARPNHVWIMADLPENILSSLNKAMPCGVELTSYPGEQFLAGISAIGEVLNNQTRTIKVRLSMPNPDEKFRPGMYAKVRFALLEKDELYVPASSIVSVNGKNYVFRREGLKHTRTEVVIENQIGEHVIILRGLSQGDTVIQEGAMLLKGLSFGY